MQQQLSESLIPLLWCYTIAYWLWNAYNSLLQLELDPPWLQLSSLECTGLVVIVLLFYRSMGGCDWWKYFKFFQNCLQFHLNSKSLLKPSEWDSLLCLGLLDTSCTTSALLMTSLHSSIQAAMCHNQLSLFQYCHAQFMQSLHYRWMCAYLGLHYFVYGPLLGTVSVLLHWLSGFFAVVTRVDPREPSKPNSWWNLLATLPSLCQPPIKDIRFEFDFDPGPLSSALFMCRWRPEHLPWPRPTRPRSKRLEHSQSKHFQLRFRIKYRVLRAPVKKPWLCPIWYQRNPSGLCRRLKTYLKSWWRAPTINTEYVEMFDKATSPNPMLNFLDMANQDELTDNCKLYGLVPDDFRFLLRYGEVNTSSKLTAETMDLSIMSHTLLHNADPLEEFQILKEFESPEFLASVKEITLRKEREAMVASVVAGRDASWALSQPHSATANKAIAYLNQPHSSAVPIVVDTGCSISMTPFKSDFVGPLESAECQEVKGFGNHRSPIQGIGWVEWNIVDVFGKCCTIRTRAYYVPQADIRLFSPQSYFREQNGGNGYFDQNKVIITTKEGVDLNFPYHPCSNLPLMLLRPDPPRAGLSHVDMQLCQKRPNSEHYPRALLSVCDEVNQNITQAQKEALLWHFRLCHANFGWIQTLLRSKRSGEAPIIPPRNKQASSCAHPLCAACQFGKQSRRPANKPGHFSVDSAKEMALKKEKLEVGQRIHGDQYISAVPGRTPVGRGSSAALNQYTGGVLLADSASEFIFLRNQVTLGTGDTLQTKQAFEHFAAQYGVKLQSFRVDNMPFASKEFRADCEAKGQTIDFSGVGAHHQNGVAERALKTITQWARSMMLHSLLHWPEEADASLWPLALEHAVYLWNYMPNIHSGFAPIEIFTGTKLKTHATIMNARVWGCPVYVLDPKLQDGKKIPKWKPRSRLGKFVGYSPEHSTNVGRILNLQTGYVSPQFHVVYDEMFSSVPTIRLEAEAFDAATWQTLVQLGCENTFDSFRDVDPKTGRIAFEDFFQQFLESNSASVDDDDGSEGDGDSTASDETLPVSDPAPPPPKSTPNEGDTPSPISQNEGATSTRSGRQVRRPARFRNALTAQQLLESPRQKIRYGLMEDETLHGLDWSRALTMLKSPESKAILSDAEFDLADGTAEYMHPLTLAARLNDADNPRWEEAMNGPLKEGFWEACEKEIETLKAKDTWDEVDRKPWMNVLPGVWAFKIKRRPSGEAYKLKSRFCVKGCFQQHNIDYFDTNSPVVSWTTVRLMLILSVILKLESKQIDYRAAFVHSDIDLPPDYDLLSDEEKSRVGVFVEMPRGFAKEGKVLKLKKSLYGLKQAPRNWYLHLRTKLENIGLQCQEDVDRCLFISNKVICVLYCDDSILFARDKADIDEVIAKLREAELELDEEGDVAGFLGVHLERHEDGKHITLTQKGLIQKIVEALNLEDQPPVFTPADDVLVKDETGDPPNGTYNYGSVVGMLLYLCGHTRPDIQMAVSQVARFTHCPKRSHELALERIGRYLKSSMDKGMILEPSDTLDIDAFVDADFCGLWKKEERSDSTSVKSRTGFVICLANCPILWKSSLQTRIANSTMEAEYNALSSSMKEVLPLQALIKAIAVKVDLPEVSTVFRTTVWEDNIGCETLANLDPGQHTPRSKWYDISAHWFRSKLKPNKVTVQRIDTSEQRADIFTKPLVRATFERLRRMLIGW